MSFGEDVREIGVRERLSPAQVLEIRDFGESLRSILGRDISAGRAYDLYIRYGGNAVYAARICREDDARNV